MAGTHKNSASRTRPCDRVSSSPIHICENLQQTATTADIALRAGMEMSLAWPEYAKFNNVLS